MLAGMIRGSLFTPTEQAKIDWPAQWAKLPQLACPNTAAMTQLRAAMATFKAHAAPGGTRPDEGWFERLLAGAELLMAVGDDLARCRVALLEQPLPRGADRALENLKYPVSVCADESCQSSVELEAVADRYDAINIKLDKCGGLTDALKMREWCLRYGKQIMVGNMLGSSLAMAPAKLYWLAYADVALIHPSLIHALRLVAG